MKNTIAIFLAALILVPAVQASAADSERVVSVKSWFNNVRLALKKSAVQMRYRNVRLGAVAAVRGSKQYWGPEKPYWKGSWSEKSAGERAKEREVLGGAVDLVLAGKTKEGAAALDAFEKQYPASPLLQELAEIRVKLAELESANAPAAAAPTVAPKSEEAVKSPAAAQAAKPAEAAGAQ